MTNALRWSLCIDVNEDRPNTCYQQQKDSSGSVELSDVQIMHKFLKFKVMIFFNNKNTLKKVRDGAIGLYRIRNRHVVTTDH